MLRWVGTMDDGLDGCSAYYKNATRTVQNDILGVVRDFAMARSCVVTTRVIIMLSMSCFPNVFRKFSGFLFLFFLSFCVVLRNSGYYNHDGVECPSDSSQKLRN